MWEVDGRGSYGNYGMGAPDGQEEEGQEGHLGGCEEEGEHQALPAEEEDTEHRQEVHGHTRRRVGVRQQTEEACLDDILLARAATSQSPYPCPDDFA